MAHTLSAKCVSSLSKPFSLYYFLLLNSLFHETKNTHLVAIDEELGCDHPPVLHSPAIGGWEIFSALYIAYLNCDFFF